MKKKIRFYKTENNWYADLPLYIEAGGSLEDCQMIAGADEWLDYLSENGDEITLLVSDSEPLKEKLIFFCLGYEQDEDIKSGATYASKKDYEYHYMWLCDVTLFVFCEFPEIIYYEKI